MTIVKINAQKHIATSQADQATVTRTHHSKKHAYAPKHKVRAKQAQTTLQSTSLAVEAAIAIVINGIHYAVLMASPRQLEYLAIGFLFSEGLIHHSHELLDWEVTQLTDVTSYRQFTQVAMQDHTELDTLQQAFLQLQDYDIYVVELTLNQRCHQRIKAQKRLLAGRTGCGMCGITGLTQALPDLSGYLMPHHNNTQQAAPQKRPTAPSLDDLLDLQRQVNAMQQTHQLTGAAHAAATMYDQQLYLFEDVGRHNALDKLIGWQLRHKAKVTCVLMTSRLSIELVQKSIRGGIPWLIGMSAPTSTAVRVAQRYGLGLAGFLRDDRVTYYTDI